MKYGILVYLSSFRLAFSLCGSYFFDLNSLTTASYITLQDINIIDCNTINKLVRYTSIYYME